MGAADHLWHSERNTESDYKRNWTYNSEVRHSSNSCALEVAYDAKCKSDSALLRQTGLQIDNKLLPGQHHTWNSLNGNRTSPWCCIFVSTLYDWLELCLAQTDFWKVPHQLADSCTSATDEPRNQAHAHIHARLCAHARTCTLANSFTAALTLSGIFATSSAFYTRSGRSTHRILHARRKRLLVVSSHGCSPPKSSKTCLVVKVQQQVTTILPPPRMVKAPTSIHTRQAEKALINESIWRIRTYLNILPTSKQSDWNRQTFRKGCGKRDSILLAQAALKPLCWHFDVTSQLWTDITCYFRLRHHQSPTPFSQ